MQKKAGRWNVRTMMYIALLIALQIILTRLFVLDLGPYRISFGSVASILAGLWFGPAAGGVCGFTADILGCFVKGYTVNPFITAAAVLWGVIPAIAAGLLKGRTKKARMAGLCVSIAITGIISSIVLTTAGLVIFLGYHLYAILPGRLVQAAVMIPCYCVLTLMIYTSRVTAMVSSGGAAGNG